jgi:hypothetical protein
MFCVACSNTRRVIEYVANWTKAWSRPCPRCVGHGDPSEWHEVDKEEDQ